MAEGATVTVRLELLAEPTPEWCDTCLLPSRVSVPAALVFDGVPSGVGTFSTCDCDAEADPITMEGQP